MRHDLAHIIHERFWCNRGFAAEMGTAHRSSARFGIVHDYDVDNVSNKVTRIVLSYTDFVNRVVWRKLV